MTVTWVRLKNNDGSYSLIAGLPDGSMRSVLLLVSSLGMVSPQTVDTALIELFTEHESQHPHLVPTSTLGLQEVLPCP